MRVKERERKLKDGKQNELGENETQKEQERDVAREERLRILQRIRGGERDGDEE